MAQDTLSLWPASIRPSIKSPATILAAQAKELSLQTDGVLIGEFHSSESADWKHVVHALDMYAPALNYRHRVLTATHARELVYPVVIDAEVFKPRERDSTPQAVEAFAALRNKGVRLVNEATSDVELIDLVKRVLTSPQVVGIAISLIARVEELDEQAKQSSNGTPSRGDGVEE